MTDQDAYSCKDGSLIPLPLEHLSSCSGSLTSTGECSEDHFIPMLNEQQLVVGGVMSFIKGEPLTLKKTRCPCLGSVTPPQGGMLVL